MSSVEQTPQQLAFLLTQMACEIEFPSNPQEQQEQQQQQRSIERPQWQNAFLRVFWEGGSTFDAWLNILSSKIAEGLLLIPHSCAQMGIFSGLAFQVIQLALGWWSCCMINTLYLRYKSVRQKEDPLCFERHTIQFYEVLGELLGPWWKVIALVFQVAILFSFSSIQILACSNIVYFINDKIEKRTWTLIFGAFFSLSILIPTAHNYRVWSFIGVVANTYTAWFLTIAALTHDELPDVSHSGPYGYTGYFTGLTNLIALGGEIVPVEIMDAMWKPREFKKAYLYGMLYVLFLTLPSSASLYWKFGDKSLDLVNALSLLPKSKFLHTAVVLLIIHQFMVFGIFSLPLYLTWEKLFRVHKSESYITRTLVRIPVFLCLWFAALAFPFFGVINSVFGSIFMSWGAYIIPCGSFVAAFWTRASRLNDADLPFPMLNWEATFSINLAVVLWLVFVGSVVGAWSSIVSISKQAHQFGFFIKCYECTKRLY